MEFYTSVQSLGDNILVRSYENGERISYRDKFNPTLFVSDGTGKSKFKTIYGKSVAKVNPGSISDCRDFIDDYKEIENFDVYGYTDWSQQYIGKNYYGNEFDISKIKICTLDIETTSDNGFPDVDTARESIIAITIRDNIDDQYYIFGVGEYVPNADNVHYLNCTDEKDLLEKFIKVYQVLKPDIITGWNVKFFDVPYLVKRIEKLLSKRDSKKLSHWNYIRERTVVVMGRSNLSYILFGVAQLDYLDLYKKFTYTNRESYKLNYIAQVELGEKKISYDEHRTLTELYKNDYQKFIDYNMKDVELVDNLEKKLRLIELCVTMAYDAGINYEDVFSQVRFWDALIYNHLRKKNIVVPHKPKNPDKPEFVGGYVKEPKLGMHKWVVSFDLNSLYPHLIMQYNISPETVRTDLPRFFDSHGNLVDELLNKVELPDEIMEKENVTMTANGLWYSREKQGFLPELMQQYYDDRVKYKQMMVECQKSGELENVAKYDTYQMARKISLNSAYGALGNEYFRYFDVKQAEAITTSGQLAIRWVEKYLNKYLNKILRTDDVDYVIASDTDSVYLTLDALVESHFSTITDKNKIVGALDRVCIDLIEPLIDECYEELADYLNVFQQKMIMKREVIADKGIWTAKKRYMLNVYDSEGVRYDEPKLKVMGIESVRSSTPSACRERLRESIELIMNESEDVVVDYIEDFKKEFSTLDSSEIAFPRAVRGLKKYYSSSDLYIKSTPIQVKGSLIYNNVLTKNGLSKVYPTINEGENIKFLYLKEPNPTYDKVIAFIDELPEEFGLNKYIDYDTQFNKGYLEPIKSILDVIGWEHERVSTLEGFFA